MDHTLRVWLVDTEYLLKLADALIQRDPPIFVGLERARFGFQGPSLHEQNMGDPAELQALRLEYLAPRANITPTQAVTVPIDGD